MPESAAHKLFNAVNALDVDEVNRLLKAGASPNGYTQNNGLTAVLLAAYKGHLEIVKALVDAGADIMQQDADGTAEDNARKGGHSAIVAFLASVREKRNVDIVTFQRLLGDRTLQEVFDFVACERISLIRENGKSARVEAAVITGFSALENQDRLREAFEEHVRRGGKTEESVVFKGVMGNKRKLNPSP